MSAVPHPTAFQIIPPNLINPKDLIPLQSFNRASKVWEAGKNASAIDPKLAEMRTGMKWDPTAAELFKTIHTTLDPKAAAIGTHYSSIHELIAGDGTLHFHPETQGNKAASERILILYPYGDGAEFEWAGLENAKPYHDTNKNRNCVQGDIQAPHFSINLKPGQVTLVNLFSGAHAFRGDTLALSIHPLDIVEDDDVDTGIERTGDSMMDNTWEYCGERPDSATIIKPKPFKFITPDAHITLDTLMADHLKTAKNFINKGPDRTETIANLVEEMRAPYQALG